MVTGIVAAGHAALGDDQQAWATSRILLNHSCKTGNHNSRISGPIREWSKLACR
jgi:hypothetical protein